VIRAIFLALVHRLLKHADLLMADTNFLADQPATTMAFDRSRSRKTLAKEAQVKRLLLTHLPQQLDLVTLKDQAQSS
jgi:ribonuclease BN (tRNA processing enzyme)